VASLFAQGLSKLRYQPEAASGASLQRRLVERVREGGAGEQVSQWCCLDPHHGTQSCCALTGVPTSRIVRQVLIALLSAGANLRIPLSLEEWRCVMHACLESLPLQGFNPQLATSVIWSGSVYGYLEDPSTAECLAELRHRAEQLARSGLQTDMGIHLNRTVRQASVSPRYFRLILSNTRSW
jgi:hypothetical protein